MDKRDAETGDLVLLSRVCEGNEAAFEKLYALYYSRLYRFLYRIGAGAHSPIEELINEVMYLVWCKADTFSHSSRVSTWIFGVAVNVSRKYHSKEQRYRSKYDESIAENHIEHACESWEKGLEISDLLDKSLMKLSPDHRAVVELTYFQGFHYREIAEILGCPENTVKTRMYHARIRLNELMCDFSQGSLDEGRR